MDHSRAAIPPGNAPAAGPGRLLLSRDVTVTEEQQRAIAAAFRPRWWRLPLTRGGWQALSLVLCLSALTAGVLALIVCSIVALAQHSWRAFAWGAVAVPCVAVATTLGYLVVKVAPVLPSLRADVEAVVRRYAPGPLRIEVYDRGLRLVRPDGTVALVSGVCRVTTHAERLHVTFGGGSVVVVPGSIAAAELDHLVGLPEVEWPEGSIMHPGSDRV